jgi:hypothetical protein
MPALTMTERRYKEPCSECPAPEECWNYGYAKDTNERIDWFDCHKNIPESHDADGD